jgi:transcriptional regulator with XRE-family HTH domain
MSDSNFYITGIQARLARTALNKSLLEIAKEAELGVNTVGRFEQTGKFGHARTIMKLVDTYNRLGIEFPDRRTIRLPDNVPA